MSTYPSSICATDGSNNSFPLLPAVESLLAKKTQANNLAAAQALAAKRLNAYLNDPVDSQPRFSYTNTGARMAAHTKDVMAGLEAFDDKMKKTKD